MTQTLTKMADDLAKTEHTQVSNIKQLIPELAKKNFEGRIRHTLLGLAPPEPKTTISRPIADGTCSQCRLPFKYDHMAWCRGLSNGYTCRCPKRPATPYPTSVSSRGSNSQIAVKRIRPRVTHSLDNLRLSNTTKAKCGRCYHCDNPQHTKPN